MFAASQIYTMLKEYSDKVTVKIDALAASAASVVAMAGDETYMSPTALLMVHDPSTVAIGNESDMKEAIKVLKEVKESIINAYETKTGQTREALAKLMQDDGTWINATKAVELGFADGILYTDGDNKQQVATAYSPHHVIDSLTEQIKASMPVSPEPEDVPDPEDIEETKDETLIRMRMLGIRI